MIIEHAKSNFAHNVLIKGDNGELVVFISDRAYYSRKPHQTPDWRVYTAKNEMICHLFAPDTQAKKSLDEIIEKVKLNFDEIKEMNNVDLYILQLKSNYGFKYYFMKSREFCAEHSVLSFMHHATPMSLNEAKDIAHDLLENSSRLRFMHIGDTVAEVVICKATTEPVSHLTKDTLVSSPSDIAKI